MPPPGYHGSYRRIDVGDGSFAEVPLDERVLRNYLGGSGLGTYLLHAEAAAELDPLAPNSPLAFVFSPLVGSPLTTSAKFAVVGKSPLTTRINDSLASSRFAISGKKSGCDALVLTGQAARPSVVVIDDGAVRIEPAGDLWGTPIPQAEAELRRRLGPEYDLAVIGPAGERQVRFATISHDGRHAGRGGSGAVLGAKRIKAIAVRGTRRTPAADSDGLVALAKDLSQRSFGPATAKYRELGTASNLLTFNRLNALPTRNFQQGSFEHAVGLSPEQLAATREKTRGSCAACTIGCEHIYGVRSSDASKHGQPDGAGVRLEYENLFALGPLCGVSDSDVVLAASRRCDQLGLDTISAGGTIAFAMECVQRGLLDAPWLTFGSGSGLLRALDEIGHRRGLGDRLAEGSRRMAQQIGHDSIHFAPQVKGLEIPGYEPRSLQMMALGFAVGSRGADHNRSGAYEIDFSDRVDRRNVQPDDAVLAVETEDRAALIDSLILCKFLRGALDDLFAESADMLKLATGWDVDAAELRQTAQRIVTAKKLFNIRAGWQPAEDTLPDRLLQQGLPDDPKARLTRERLEAMVVGYNRARGWSDDGWPSDGCVRELGLAEQAGK